MSDLALVVLIEVLALGGLAFVVFKLLKSPRARQAIGIPMKLPRECPRCSARLPAIRMPRSLRQLLIGGWTCAGCKAEVTKWGEVKGSTKL